MPHVYSTLTCDQQYVAWKKGGNDVNMVEHSILIKGGTGIANKNIITPYGVRTEISDQEAELLKQNKVFQVHEQNGFVRIEQRSVEPEKVAADMSARDESAPLTPGDYTNQPETAVQEPEAGGRRGRKGNK